MTQPLYFQLNIQPTLFSANRGVRKLYSIYMQNLKYTITLLLALFSLSVFSQQSENLVGKWEYEDIYNKEDLDSIGLQLAPMFFAEMTYYFGENGDYRFFMMGKADEGTWQLTDDGLYVEVTSNKGEVMKMRLVEVSENKLILSLSTGIDAAILMNRIEPSEEDLKGNPKVEVKAVSASLEQIAKKWYAQKKESEKDKNRAERFDDKELAKNVGELVDGIVKRFWFDFGAEGEFKAFTLIDEEGTWEFGEDNRSIIVLAGEFKKIWYIESVSENELVLIKGKTDEKWFFSTNKLD